MLHAVPFVSDNQIACTANIIQRSSHGSSTDLLS